MTIPTSQDQGRVVEASKRFMAASNSLGRLLAITDEAVEILYLLNLAKEEGVDESELVARLAEVETLLAGKLENCAWTVHDLERLAEARKAEGDKLRDQAKTIERAADRLRGLMLTAMKQTGQERVVTGRFTIRRQLNPPHVDVLEPAMVPNGFLRHIPEKWEVNKVAILANFKTTGEIPDGVNIARDETVVIS